MTRVFGLSASTTLFLLFAHLLTPSVEAAPSPVAHLKPAKKTANLPPGLTWKSRKLQVVSRVRGKKLRTYAVLRGFFQKPGWKLKINEKERLRISREKGRFALAVRLKGSNTPVTIRTLGPKGEKITYQTQVEFKAFRAYQKKQIALERAKLKSKSKAHRESKNRRKFKKGQRSHKTSQKGKTI